MTCTVDPVPAGWRVWRGPVPTALAQFAMGIRDHVRSYPMPSIAATITHAGQPVAAWVSHHTWTWRGGHLIEGICIPGVSLLVQAGDTVADPADGTSGPMPDPSLAMYSADQTGHLDPFALFGLGVLSALAAEWLMKEHRRR